MILTLSQKRKRKFLELGLTLNTPPLAVAELLTQTAVSGQNTVILFVCMNHFAVVS